MSDVFGLILYIVIFGFSTLFFGYGNYRKNKIIIWAGLFLSFALASLCYLVSSTGRKVHPMFLFKFGFMPLIEWVNMFNDCLGKTMAYLFVVGQYEKCNVLRNAMGLYWVKKYA